MNNLLNGQSAHKLLRQGDKAYKKESYQEAEENYRKSLDKANSVSGKFNLGNSLYNQERFEEAIEQYRESQSPNITDIEKANALYNLGNAQLSAGQVEEAISSYKDALRLNNEDEDIARNLFLAKVMQQQQQEQQQQQQNQQNEEDQNQDQSQEESDNNEQQQQESSTVDNEGAQNTETPTPQNLSKEDALKLLQVIENEEKNVQEKLRKMSGSKKKPKKDW